MTPLAEAVACILDALDVVALKDPSMRHAMEADLIRARAALTDATAPIVGADEGDADVVEAV